MITYDKIWCTCILEMGHTNPYNISQYEYDMIQAPYLINCNYFILNGSQLPDYKLQNGKSMHKGR